MVHARTVAAVLGAALVLVPASAGAAVAPQPAPDISKLPYQPIGHFKGTDTIPAADSGCADSLQALRKGEVFNPSGTFNAYDNNVFEVLCYPFRAPGDTTDNDPVGNKGAAQHGRCGGTYDGSTYGNFAALAGVCDNHQLEWIRYYEATMLEILKDFGATAHRYTFDVPDPGVTGNTRFGRGINPAIVIPGADNPEEQIVIGAHYDKTNDGPASFWDSQEGHAEMIRVAKLMADYWKATGTRPSATVKFIPWDAEESGTFGSLDYATNNIVPGEESKVRGYWNTDPCAGGYPSFRYGNPADRLRMGIQLADPAAISEISEGDTARINAFNKNSGGVVEQTLDHIDDTVDSVAGPVQTFLSSGEGASDVGKTGGIFFGTDRPVLFSSDWRNFEVLGIPFFNPGPEVTGPNQETGGGISYGPDQSLDALTTFHTPNDNIQTMTRFTGGGIAGTTFSESYAKGMEFCSHLLAWGMLQPDQGGGQKASTDVVAYYEALPNEAIEDQKITFDAEGSYQYASVASRTYVPESQLEYSWEFGDGTTARGKKVEHAYTQVGKYPSKLTVRNTKTGRTKTMSIGITVLPNSVGPPVLTPPAASDEDGTFQLTYDYTGDRKGLAAFSIEESTDAVTSLNDDAEKLDAWVAGDAPSGVAPWQLSSSSTPKYFGAGPQGGASAFWTGVANGSDQYSAGPTAGESILTLKEPVRVGKGGNVSLSFGSNFVNDAGDVGIAQVAVVDGSTSEPDWVTVDTVKPGANDEDSLSIFEQQQLDDSRPAYSVRFVDLTRFGGRRVKVRFVYRLGAHDTVPAARTGWYVDNVKLVSGSYREIGTTSDKQFTVSGRTKGTYGYRVKAVFADGVKSSASNTENVDVTVGARVAAGRCARADGFKRASLKRLGGSVLGFDITPVSGPAVVEVLRASSGPDGALRALRRVVRFAGRSAGFRWDGRVHGRVVPAGVYVVRFRAANADGTTDLRSAVVERRGRRWVPRRPFEAKGSCALVSVFKLSSPVFSGRVPLGIAVATTQPASVRIAVFRGSAKVPVRSLTARTRTGRLTKFRFKAGTLPRGTYRVRVTATRGKARVVRTLYAARL
jgi:PKD repeat protein